MNNRTIIQSNGRKRIKLSGNPLKSSVEIVERVETPVKEYVTAESCDDLNVGDGCTVYLFSDAHAYTVVHKTAKTMKIQRDRAILLNGMNSDAEDKLEFTPGGFVGHTSGTQRYEYFRDTNEAIVTVTKRKNGTWKVARSSSRVRPGRNEHYDYNF